MAFTTSDVQVRLKNLGFYGGKIDGDFGPASCAAAMRALELIKTPVAPVINPSLLTPAPISTTPVRGAVVPADWLQSAVIQRVILHWTVGSHTPSDYDKQHYHILVSGTGGVVKGSTDIAGNSSSNPRGKKASHTLNCNTGSIGVSLAGMMDAQQSPLKVGPYPITQVQWDKAAIVVAELCHRYRIPVTPKTVLSHAEVQVNLGIQQRGKWDIAILPWNRAFDTARECGDQFRKQVQAHLNLIS